LITVDYRDKRPLYEQILEQYRRQILSGAMAPDERLPSVREVSVQLGINPNTVQRAYQELEREGMIYSVRGKGNFVSPKASLPAEKKVAYLKDFRKMVTDGRRAGMKKKDLLGRGARGVRGGRVKSG